MKKKVLQILKWGFIYTVITLVFLEVLLRILGYRPYSNKDYKVSSTPDYPYIADETLGIRLHEGIYKITLNNAVTFTATHLPNGERNTPKDSIASEREIVFLGCSYTYGYGVNDDQSYPAIIQQMLSNYSVRNKAVVGYGTCQHLLQLRKHLETNTPSCVILAFSSAHFIRTVLSQQYRANLRIGYRRSSASVDDRMKGARFPYMTSCGKIEFQNWESMYPEIPGRYWLAMANYLQINYDNSKEPDCDPVKITACIIREMASLCKEKNVPFGVICLDKSQESKQLEKQLKSVAWKNIGFSFESKKYTLYPHDSHANASGHQLIANRAYPFVEKLLKHANK